MPGRKGSDATCYCRSKSLEDLRTEVVEVGSEWDGEVSEMEAADGGGRGRYGRQRGGMSMESLLMVDANYKRRSRMVGRMQVGSFFRLVGWLVVGC